MRNTGLHGASVGRVRHSVTNRKSTFLSDWTVDYYVERTNAERNILPNSDAEFMPVMPTAAARRPNH
jgi:hypothetical protein